MPTYEPVVCPTCKGNKKVKCDTCRGTRVIGAERSRGRSKNEK